MQKARPSLRGDWMAGRAGPPAVVACDKRVGGGRARSSSVSPKSVLAGFTLEEGGRQCAGFLGLCHVSLSMWRPAAVHVCGCHGSTHQGFERGLVEPLWHGSREVTAGAAASEGPTGVERLRWRWPCVAGGRSLAARRWAVCRRCVAVFTARCWPPRVSSHGGSLTRNPVVT